MRLHMDNASIRRTVPGCHFTGTILSRLEQHMVVHFEVRHHVCNVPCCSFNCTSNDGLKYHMWIEHANGKPYSCSMPGCHYETVRKGRLATHMLVHTGEKRYRCNVHGCGYQASQLCHLDSHMRTHTCTASLLCKVPGCAYTAPGYNILKFHMRTHTAVESKVG